MPFQSTHPLRGATRLVNDFLIGHIISIHAPLAGCDGKGICSVFVLFNFNPRTPCGVRRPHLYAASPSIVFQSTHPLRGATISSSSIASPFVYFNPRTPCGVRLDDVTNGDKDLQISIHAPLAGCDIPRLMATSVRYDFNPRTPCGVRPPCMPRGRTATTFQSTHPLRGATRRDIFRLRCISISIHAPLAGCDIRHAAR